MKAIRIDAPGGPEVMRYVDISVAEPGPGEVRVRHTAIAVNFIDTYHRSGLYPLPMPAGLGIEAAGVVEATGAGVEGLQAGDRVVYMLFQPGAYASHRIVPASALVKLPDDISDRQAAALWMKACTVEALVERCARVKAGDRVLVPAAAGGVGLLLCQWLKSVGATVIGTVGSPEKAALAREAGADHVLDYADVPLKVRELTGGHGVDHVLDGVGKSTFESSLDSLKRRGLMVSFGNASGPVGAVDFTILVRKGSLFATRPSVADYYGTPEDVALGTAAVFQKIRSNVLRAHIGQTFPLAEAERCHRALEARETVGSSLLIP
ncbi:quinone oxidoreductase [Sandaracinobacter sp. RS1-74]|uniref:quinone oxidoreductase family protein n=1 Tax=Sandaracinobacteroides sayramensis TaxID=2913411 RepID=UPI001EDB07F1|nr:quinone oxidoreductase [Sandaracinobacteroides sayramensis]MCG2841431.1 quinone oxidoreductase [Sandaracinobacteroides sayramensis]